MMGQPLTRSISPPTILSLLIQQEQEAWNNVSHDDSRHLYDRVHTRVQTYVAVQERSEVVDVFIFVICNLVHLTIYYTPGIFSEYLI